MITLSEADGWLSSPFPSSPSQGLISVHKQGTRLGLAEQQGGVPSQQIDRIAIKRNRDLTQSLNSAVLGKLRVWLQDREGWQCAHPVPIAIRAIPMELQPSEELQMPGPILISVQAQL